MQASLVKSYRLVLVLLLFGYTMSRAQSNLDKVVPPLEKWAQTYPQEKVYLHTDKPYYLAGDTIWLKAYTVVGSRHQLSALSGAIYVDLITESDSVAAALKLPLTAGMGKGEIALPDELPAGNYRLRAYTQWMRNAGPAYFYDRSFPIGSISAGKSRSKAVFSYLPGDNGAAVTADISYQDLSGQPLAGKEVYYAFHTGNEQLQSGTEKTDANGHIQVKLKSPKEPDSSNAFIRTEIEIAKKQVERHTIPVKATYALADVQFFPEGGDLVAGLPSRVAFKAIGPDGLGIAITGTVQAAGQEVATISSSHAGMGQFDLSPGADSKYEAMVTFPDGSKQTFALPAVKAAGYVLSVYPQAPSDTLLVRIMTSPSLLQQPVSLLVQSGGEVLYAADLKVNRPLTSLRVPLPQAPSGIAQFTLFNAQAQPVNERLAYIERNDSVSLQLRTDQASYPARSPAKLSISSLDAKGAPAAGNYSISVTDASQVPVNEDAENSILAQILLRSDLKGYIEQPNYYFNHVTDEKRDHLDLLLMTQGYRRFAWNKLLAGTGEASTIPAEKLVSSISGKLVSLRGSKPIAGGKITLFSLAANVALDTLTDESGNFVFNNLLLTDSIKFTIQGRSPKGSDKVEILLDGVAGMGMTPNPNVGDLSLNIDGQLAAYLQKTKEQDAALSSLGLDSRIIRLDEVSVTAKATAKTPRSYNLNGAGHADQVISGNELGTCPTLRMCLEGRLAGVVFRTEQTSIGPVAFPNNTRGGRMLVVVDGYTLRTDNEGGLMDLLGVLEQNTIDPSSILSIEVLRSVSLTNIYGADGRNGVILINTRGWSPNQRTDYSAKTYAPKGYSNVREFYSPKYGVSDLIDALADARSTIYWNPVVNTSADGKASVDYFNAGTPGTYRVVIEGISNQGQLARKVFEYQVK